MNNTIKFLIGFGVGFFGTLLLLVMIMNPSLLVWAAIGFLIGFTVKRVMRRISK